MKGLGCLVAPLFVYARKHATSRRFMVAWHVGVGLWIAGGIMVS
jgi:hypothetical protein